MKLQYVLLAIASLSLIHCKEKTKSEEESKQEKMEMSENLGSENDGWMVLFDGTSFDGWKGYLKDGMPANWKLEDGAMVFYPPAERPDGESYNLVTEGISPILCYLWNGRLQKGQTVGYSGGLRKTPHTDSPMKPDLRSRCWITFGILIQKMEIHTRPGPCMTWSLLRRT